MIKEYIKPDFKYWSEGELNSIEAKMSGSIGWRPNIYVTSASYDGSTITATYRVYDTITSDMDYRIGYQYAGDYNVLTMYQMSRGVSVNKAAGTYTITLSAPNRNCEIRLCVGYTKDDTVKYLYSTNWSWIYLPTEKAEYFHTVSLTEQIGFIVTKFAINFVVGCVGTCIKWSLRAINILGFIVQLDCFDTNIPSIKTGNYYKWTIWYSKSEYCLYVKTEMWDEKKDYTRKQDPDYSSTYKREIPRFS